MRSFASLSIAIMVCVFISMPAFAQSSYYPEFPANDKGYWKVFTDHKCRSTLVKFYNKDKQLVYEEVIKGKYIKLTRRNIRLLDQELDRLLGKALIVSKVKSTDLLAYHQQTFIGPPLLGQRNLVGQRNKLQSAGALLGPDSGVQLNTHMMFNSNKLRIVFENPQREKIRISLKDETGFTIYEENCSISRYFRDINLNGLVPGVYVIHIKGGSVKYSKSFGLSYTPGNYHVRILPQSDSQETKSFYEAID